MNPSVPTTLLRQLPNGTNIDVKIPTPDSVRQPHLSRRGKSPRRFFPFSTRVTKTKVVLETGPVGSGKGDLDVGEVPTETRVGRGQDMSDVNYRVSSEGD